MGCGDVRLLRTIGGLDVTGQERAALNKLTMPTGDVTGTRAVSLAARLKTAGTPDRCELPMREGHVRRCVPGKRVLNGC